MYFSIGFAEETFGYTLEELCTPGFYHTIGHPEDLFALKNLENQFKTMANEKVAGGILRLRKRPENIFTCIFAAKYLKEILRTAWL